MKLFHWRSTNLLRKTLSVSKSTPSEQFAATCRGSNICHLSRLDRHWRDMDVYKKKKKKKKKN